MHKLYKKLAILLMALNMALAVAGCDPQDGNTSNSADSTASDTDTEENDNTDSDTSESDSAETEDSSEDEEQSAKPMEVQDNVDVEIGAGDEGAW